jgi:CBS domain containing-hemolysin-like protein
VNVPFILALAFVLVVSGVSLLFSSLTYSLRGYTRSRLHDRFERAGIPEWFEPTVERSGELIFATAIGRLFANLLVFIGVLHMLRVAGIEGEWSRYGVAVLVTSLLTLFVSVAVPHALAEHVGEALVVRCVRFLHGLRIALLPLMGVMRFVDRLVRNMAGQPPPGTPNEQLEEQIEQEILSVVEEGQKEGVVDSQERDMIESVIEFGDRSVAEAMTQRADIIGIPSNAKIDQVKSVLEESGHSRIPVYEGTTDRIVGVLYARDLIRHLGQPCEQFDVRTAMRPALEVPKTRLMRDVLQDFRKQKVHIAIVLDEYGGTAGLITIEDVLSELVGEMSDEHEPSEPSLLKRTDDRVAEADARIFVEQLNRIMGLNIPEDAGYETLGGFVSTTLGRIPATGTSFEHHGARYTILDAQPQRVNKVKIEVLTSQPLPTA